jgi:hypothetical protein
MDDVGIFYGHLVYFTVIWYTLLSFGIFLPVLLCCNKKNLATLNHTYCRTEYVKRFKVGNSAFYSKKAECYLLRCKLLQRWRCNSQS